jgi:two-component system, chemotaxis family, sensor kinase CheA
MAKDPYKYFRLEARELLDGLSQGVLALERGAFDAETVARLLRLAHTLKGASRVVKLVDLARQAHAVEDLLAPYRERGPVPQTSIDEHLHVLDRMAAQLSGIDGPATVARAGPEPFATVRVELEEMDLLLEGVTEATVQINSLHRDSVAIEHAQHVASLLVEQLSPRRLSSEGTPLAVAQRAHALAEELRASLERLGRSVSGGVTQVTREIAQVREAANRLRLLPTSVLFSPLERAVRDAAHQLDKRVSFHTSGGDGRLDAHVLAALRDALLHVVRNAVAHGIEPVAERRALGKPAEGRVSLVVERRGSAVAFGCRDDGRGIDVETLKREAIRSGVLAQDDATRISQRELFRLVLKGGVTTSPTVTEVSGRGIGLDVVRETAARLKGEVIIESEPGSGTSVEILVPVSLSSQFALVVEAAGVAAVVPIDSVRRTMRVARSDIASASAGDSIVFESQVIPFFPLAKALRRQAPPTRTKQHSSLVVVESGGRLAALGIDRFVGTAIIVVRPLPPWIDADPVVAGAALDAEGNPQLVLDPAGLVEAAHAGSGAQPGPEAAARLPVLIVDDSLTTRMLEQSILESAGYEVDLATSAEDALLKAGARRYGLFVVDVEMPGMDGFGFVARTRGDPALRDTPAILVTSRNSPDDRRRGEEAGARAYIVKGEFDQGYLLETIRKLVG